LVNLKKETYSEAIRILQMEFSTLEEDAHHPDAIINPQLYTLKIRIIEDHTGYGPHDLTSGVARMLSCPFEALM
jgi:tRNA nucleotidyltransferase/poly(A) polymerase